MKNNANKKNGLVFTSVLDTDDCEDKIIDFSKMHQAFGVNALSENNGSQNKNVGDNGGSGSATYSEFSAERFTDEISGILSFN
jgi:hypothetical protein